MDHADSLTKIAKETLAGHVEDGGQEQKADAGQEEEEMVEKEEKEIVTQEVERKIVLSEDVLLTELQKFHPNDKWNVVGLSCQPDKMAVTVKGHWLGVVVEALFDLHIESMVVNDKEQMLTLTVKSMTLQTEGLWGRLLLAVLSPFKPFGLQVALSESEWKDCVAVEDGGKRLRVDLSVLPIIEKLCRPQIASLETTAPLHLIGVKGAGHDHGGMVIYLSMSETIEKIVKKMVPLMRKAGKAGLGLLKFGVEQADRLTKIAKETLAGRVEGGDCESESDANRKKEETNDRKASE